jgi:hypothetical protein
MTGIDCLAALKALDEFAASTGNSELFRAKVRAESDP